MTSIIDISTLTYAYPDAEGPVFRDLDWQVDSGSFALLTGPSGSGKSTLLRTLNGLVPHFSGGRFGGRAVVAGFDIAKHGPRELSRHVGLVFQDPEPQMITDRVDDEICFALEQRGMSRPEMRRRLEDVLDLLGIAHLRYRSPRHLSGGEQQRVAIAAAMAMTPDILVLDEPTSQLDPAAADAVIEHTGRLHHDLGLTVVMAEHRLERLLHRVDVVTDLDDTGQIRVHGNPSRVAHDFPLPALPPVTQLARLLGWPDLPLALHEMRRMPEFDPLRASLEGKAPGIPGNAAGPVVAALEQVTVKREGRDILRNIDFPVSAGECVALVGRNGSGKTTLLRTLLGFHEAASGKVTRAHESFAYLPQHPSRVFFQETVADEVAWTLKQRGARETVDDVLAAFGIAHRAGAHPRDLSGGERERAALATMLAGSPPLVVLDEPTRGMDAFHKASLMEELERRRQQGAAILLATHDVELVAKHATRVAMLGEGEIIADGHAREVLGGSLSFSPQMNRLFGSTWLTVEDVAGVVAGQ